MSKRRIVIIGAGGILDSHLQAIQSNADRAELVAISDIREDRVAEVCKRHDIPKGYTDSAKMLAEQKPDLVHIITPPATHKDLITMTLDAGAWVLCEKPLCRSLARI